MRGSVLGTESIRKISQIVKVETILEGVGLEMQRLRTSRRNVLETGNMCMI
jgi:hypothetical protein